MIPLSDEHLHGIIKKLRMWRRFIGLAFDWLKGSGRSGTARDRNGADRDPDDHGDGHSQMGFHDVSPRG
jgi:hypothetical protein